MRNHIRNKTRDRAGSFRGRFRPNERQGSRSSFRNGSSRDERSAPVPARAPVHAPSSAPARQVKAADAEPKKEKKADPLAHFLVQFGIYGFDKGKDELLFQDGKYYLVSQEISEILKKTKKPFYAGVYLGKARGEKLFPSINFLGMIKKATQHKVWIDKKTGWLFVCGRDAFAEGIKRASRPVRKGIITLVLNEDDEVLGFGKVVAELSSKGSAIKNILDIGDFLRREKKN